MATILDVDAIATDDDLANEVASRARLERANRDETQRDAIRERALDDVLTALQTRAPPITEAMLANPAELKQAVVYRALSKIFLSAIAVEGDLHDVLHRNYEREYQAAVRARFTTGPMDAGQTTGYSVSIGRR